MPKNKIENTLKVSEDFIRETLKKNFRQKKINAEELPSSAERLVDATSVRATDRQMDKEQLKMQGTIEMIERGAKLPR